MVYPLAIALMGRGVKEKYDRDQEDAQDRIDERAARAERRAWERDDREFQRGERTRMVKNRDAIAAAAAPVEPASGEVFQPAVDDEGNAMPANPTAGTFVVDGQRFSDRGAAAAAANTPEKTAERVSRAMMTTGDMAGAQSVRTGARQEKLANLQIDAATAAAERDRGLREVGSAIIQGGWGAVPGVYDKYRDGMKATVKEDGKGGATITYMDAAGKQVGSKTYAALPEFFADVAGGFDPAKWFDYQSNKADKDRLAAHQKAVLDETTRHNKATEANQALATRASMARAGGAGGGAAPATLSLKDMRDFEDDVHKRLGSEFDPKNAVDDADRARITNARNDVAARASGVFRVNAERGLPVTAEVALNALRLASNPANRREVAGNDGMVYPVVMVNGAPVIVGPGSAPKPAAQPGAPAAPNPWRDAPPGGGTVVDGKVVQQGSQPPAAPAEANPAQQAIPFPEFLAKNITTPQGKQLISQRIQRELPALKATIEQDMKVMALPMVSGAVKARLKARIEAAAQEAEMMETFLAGNAGI